MGIVVAALKLLPSKTDTHGLEGIGEYLQQVQDLLVDNRRAASAAAAPTLVDEVAASTVADLAEDVVQATSRKEDPEAVIGSKLDEGATGDAGSNAVQISQDASGMGDIGQDAAPEQPAGATSAGGPDVEDAARDQRSAGQATAPTDLVNDEHADAGAQSSSDPEER